jgi:hypothetical protein
MSSTRDPVVGPFVLPDARLSSKQKAPRGKETRPSKFVLRKNRNKVPKHSERNALEQDFSTTNYSRAVPPPMLFWPSMDSRVASNVAYDGGVGRGCGVGRDLGVGVGLGVAVGVGVGIGPDCAQYLPPVLKLVSLIPPQTIISLLVQTAV